MAAQNLRSARVRKLAVVALDESPTHVFAQLLPPGSLLLRGGPLGDRKALLYGDPFEHSAVAIPKPLEGEGVAELAGYAIEKGTLTRSLIEGIERELGPLGFRTLYFDRIEDGKPRHRYTFQIKEIFMSTQAALGTAFSKLQHAIDRANHHQNKDLAIHLQTVLDAHNASVDTALNNNGADFYTRYQALDALVKAASDMATWGMTQPDTEDHVAAKHAVDAMLAVAVSVIHDIRTQMGTAPAGAPSEAA